MNEFQNPLNNEINNQPKNNDEFLKDTNTINNNFDTYIENSYQDKESNIQTPIQKNSEEIFSSDNTNSLNESSINNSHNNQGDKTFNNQANYNKEQAHYPKETRGSNINNSYYSGGNSFTSTNYNPNSNYNNSNYNSGSNTNYNQNPLYNTTFNTYSNNNQSSFNHTQNPYANNHDTINTQDYITNTVTTQKKKKNNNTFKVFLIILLCICLSFVSGLAGAFIVNKYFKNNTDALLINQVQNNDNSNKNDTSSSLIAQIANKTENSVVEITTESVTTGSFMQQYISSGAGSGVIISNDGYIITNNHVISGATNVTVTLKNGDIHKAKIIGTDSELDTALIKIDAQNLTAATFGDSSEIKVGDLCVAIGNPLGQLGGTVTNGIISALNRDIDIDGTTMNLLQTNAAINPGNSGGGLFDENGNLIGLVVAKSSGSDVEGLGFAIPINDVKNILSDLKQYGYVKGRVYLGLSLIDVPNRQSAMMYGVNSTGVYVSSVINGTNAQKAGFVPGDKIKTVDSKEVTSYKEISDYLKNKKVGDTIEFVVTRTSKFGTETEHKISLILEEYNSSNNSSNQTNNQSSGNSYNNNYGGDLDDFLGDIFGDIFD